MEVEVVVRLGEWQVLVEVRAGLGDREAESVERLVTDDLRAWAATVEHKASRLVASPVRVSVQQ